MAKPQPITAQQVQTVVEHMFGERLGLSKESLVDHEIEDGDRAHYSKRTIDVEFEYPFGLKELWGLAYRTDFDLAAHQNASGANLEYLDEDTKEKFIPHVLEPTFGLGRHVLAVMTKAYTEDEMDGEKRVVMRFPALLAPIKAAVFPLLKNKPELVAKARAVYESLKMKVPQVAYDDNGNVGKRYRRQDEIGTPYCITIDFDTLGEKPELADTVTLRDRDTGKQERLSITDAVARIQESQIMT